MTGYIWVVRYVCVVGFAICIAGICHAEGGQRQNLLNKFLVPSIVKVEVGFSKSKIVDGSEVCRSEGTGFIVNSTHIVTATHVFDFDADCGSPQIFAKSYYPKRSAGNPFNGSEWHLNAKDRMGDVALLSTDFGVEMQLSGIANGEILPCAIPVGVSDVTNGLAVKYGIPKGRRGVNPVDVTIYEESIDFPPLVEFGPTPIFSGESGGPIVSEFQVVGVMRQRLVDIGTISFFSPASMIRKLLERNDLSIDYSDICSVYSAIGLRTELREGPPLIGPTIIEGETEFKWPGVANAAPGVVSSGDLDVILQQAILTGISSSGGDYSLIKFSRTDLGAEYEIKVERRGAHSTEKLKDLSRSIGESYDGAILERLTEQYTQSE